MIMSAVMPFLGSAGLGDVATGFTEYRQDVLVGKGNSSGFPGVSLVI